MKEAVLVVDDEAGVRASLAAILGDEGYAVDEADSGERALTALEARRYDLVLLDVWLPGADGLEVLGRIREADPELPVVVISGHGTIETAVRAVRLGAHDFVEKPLSLEKTLLAVRNALQRRRLETEIRALKRQLDERYVMVGESAALKRLRAEIAQAAPTSGRVLIFGENGTGKELVARAIHARSLRASGPFVEVNCAAIPEELIESELFGHVKGAFTGALATRKGKFELADGGTIFLDEIADMSLKTQAKVLRALQEQRIEPVGGAGSVAVDVRVIAATNKDLDEEIRKSRFREDLYFRLNVVRITLPPLRDRREDIPEFVQYFLPCTAPARAARGRPPAGPSFHGGALRGARPPAAHDHPGGACRALAAALAGQRAGATQHHRAAGDHDAGGHDRAAAPAVLAPRRLTRGGRPVRGGARHAGYPGQGPGGLRAALHPPEVPGVRGKHEPDRRGSRCRAVEPLPQDEGLRAAARAAGRP
jgi:two-component system nitrogen regulation response regulator NtrX